MIDAPVAFQRRIKPSVLTAVQLAVRNDGARETLDWVYEIPGELLADASGSHGIDHAVVEWLQHVAPGHEAMETISRRNKEAAQFNLRALMALRNAMRALEAADIPSVAVKGPVLATLAERKCRSYNDVDMLVAPKHFKSTLSILTDTGATLFPIGGWKHFYDMKHAQLPLVLPMNVSLDLHWHLCSRPAMRRTWNIASVDELLERCEPLATACGPIQVLERNDMLIHTAGHAAWSGGDRLGWLLDVDAVVKAGSIDWDTVVQRSREWGLQAQVADILSRAKSTVGSGVPDEVVESLRGGGVGLAFRWSDRFQSTSGERPSRSLARMVRLDARKGLGSTLGALSKRLAAAASRRLLGLSTDAEPVIQPITASDVEWREPYFRFVVTGKAPRFGRQRLPMGRAHSERT